MKFRKNNPHTRFRIKINWYFSANGKKVCSRQGTGIRHPLEMVKNFPNKRLFSPEHADFDFIRHSFVDFIRHSSIWAGLWMFFEREKVDDLNWKKVKIQNEGDTSRFFLVSDFFQIQNMYFFTLKTFRNYLKSRSIERNQQGVSNQSKSKGFGRKVFC